MEVEEFNAVFADPEGRTHSYPTHTEALALLVGIKTVGTGWIYLGWEPLNPREDWGKEGIGKSGTAGGLAG